MLSSNELERKVERRVNGSSMNRSEAYRWQVREINASYRCIHVYHACDGTAMNAGVSFNMAFFVFTFSIRKFVKG